MSKKQAPEHRRGTERNMKIWETNGPEETFALGEQMGKQARAGEVYCLDGDLGTGKTVFTQGFAAGLGIAELQAAINGSVANGVDGDDGVQ